VIERERGTKERKREREAKSQKDISRESLRKSLFEREEER
jgi:hypothetical protein